MKRQIQKTFKFGFAQSEADVCIELEVKIKFNPYKAEPTTRHYPGHARYLEINEIRIGDITLPQRVLDEMMKQCEEKIEEACWETVAEEEASNAQEYADYQRDQREDR